MMGGAVFQQLLKRAPSMMGGAQPAPAMWAPMMMAPQGGMAMPSMAKMSAPSPGVTTNPAPRAVAPGMASGMIAPNVRDQLMRRAPMMMGRR